MEKRLKHSLPKRKKLFEAVGWDQGTVLPPSFLQLKTNSWMGHLIKITFFGEFQREDTDETNLKLPLLQIHSFTGTIQSIKPTQSTHSFSDNSNHHINEQKRSNFHSST